MGDPVAAEAPARLQDSDRPTILIQPATTAPSPPIVAPAPPPPVGPYRPSWNSLKRHLTPEWFQDAKFGLFIHWGVYSVLGDGEWVMNNRKIPIHDYEKLPRAFNPVDFDPAEWVAIAKAAGMKYITITSKHHDGFAMFDSKVSDYDITDRTAYKKDVLKLLADECHRQGLKIFFYHSQLDWHHPDDYPRGGTGRDAGRPNSGDFSKYIDYMNAQLAGLLKNTGLRELFRAAGRRTVETRYNFATRMQRLGRIYDELLGERGA